MRKKLSDESGIRTHAPEETRSLVWRLRPLGHLALKKSGGLYLLVGRTKFEGVFLQAPKAPESEHGINVGGDTDIYRSSRILKV